MEAKKRKQKFLAFHTFFLEQFVSKYDEAGSPEMSKRLSNYKNNNNTLIYICMALYSSQTIYYI